MRKAIGALFVVLAFVVLLLDYRASGREEGGEPAEQAGEGWFSTRDLGELWHNLHPSSLQLTETAISRYTFPVLWDPIMLFLLTRPAWAVFLVVGVLFLLFRRRRRKRIIFK